MSIQLKIVERDDDHFILKTDEPARFEISLTPDGIIMHGYRGTKIDLTQEPCVVYDGTARGDMSDMESLNPDLETWHGAPPETFQQVFDGLLDEAFTLLVERQKKYGPENIRKLGIFGVFGRLSDDKVERIRRGMNGRIEHGVVIIDDFTDFGDESFEDALFDIANYALIIIALKRGLWGLPLMEDLTRHRRQP